jgi:hypothetical protein
MGILQFTCPLPFGEHLGFIFQVLAFMSGILVCVCVCVCGPGV